MESRIAWIGFLITLVVAIALLVVGVGGGNRSSVASAPAAPRYGAQMAVGGGVGGGAGAIIGDLCDHIQQT